MKPREFNPQRLDVAAFAEAGAELSGAWPLAALERLAAGVSADAPPTAGDEVSWSARGLCRRRPGAAPEWRLELSARAVLRLECQRCLQPVETVVEFDRPLRFVAGEEEASALDADSDEDVLVLSRSLDLRELVEDELLLALPLVPRHVACPAPLAPAAEPASAEAAPARPNPFAALATLKKSGPAH
ncbi:MAG TPA: DUF177 domain-containing protein [Methylibium sp.]|nr:DUF177 domain-containing protein [Methylibium sp.]